MYIALAFLLVAIGLNGLLALGLKLAESWERTDVLYTLRKAYEEGRKKLLGV